MLVALDQKGNRVFADGATKGEKYFCPLCGEEVILKQGDVVIHHFAHRSKSDCDSWTADMSEWHMRMQNRYPKDWQEIIVEYNGEKHRADILHDGVVIEFQHSPISSKEYKKRNNFYMGAGYKLVWVFDARGWSLQHKYDDRYFFTYPRRFLQNSPDLNKYKDCFAVWFYMSGKEAEDLDHMKQLVWKSSDMKHIVLKGWVWPFYVSNSAVSFTHQSCVWPYVDLSSIPNKLDMNFTPYEKYVGSYVLKLLQLGGEWSILDDRFDPDCWSYSSYVLFKYKPGYINKRFGIRDDFRSREEYDFYLLIHIAKMIIDCHYFIQFQMMGHNIPLRRMLPVDMNSVYNLYGDFDSYGRFDYNEDLSECRDHVNFMKETKWIGFEEFDIYSNFTRERIAGMVFGIWKALCLDESVKLFNVRPDYYKRVNGVPFMHCYSMIATGCAFEQAALHESEWSERLDSMKDIRTFCPACGNSFSGKIKQCRLCNNESDLQYISEYEYDDRMKIIGGYHMDSVYRRV